MKKTLIALAAVAATGAAFAQSSVTVYGKVDIGVARNIGSDTTAMQQASTSRLGFKGTEDLGGGLKANFTLEHRFNPDTGGLNNAAKINEFGEVAPGSDKFWHGRSIVGVEGGFGRVDMGRDYTAAFFTALMADPFGWDGVAAQNGTTGMGATPARFDNVISYATPAMGGFKAQASYALKEAGADDGVSLRLTYTMGALSIDAGFERGVTQPGNKTVAAQNDQSEWNGVNVAYNFGMAKVNLLIANGQTAGTAAVAATSLTAAKAAVASKDTDSVVLGVVVPMGAATLKAAYGQLKVNDTTTSSKFSLGGRYALSKRTDVYASLANDSKKASNKNGWEIGLQHNF